MHTLGSINFGNIPVGSGGGSVIGADEGLVLNAGNVQLGDTAPLAAQITVQRNISFDAGSGLLFGEPATGNNFLFEIDNGVSSDTRDTVSGQSQKVIFNFNGFELHNSGTTAFKIFNAFPGGTVVSEFGSDGIILPYTTYVRNFGAAGSMGFINDFAGGVIDYLIGGVNTVKFFDGSFLGIGGNAIQILKDGVGASVFYDVDYYTGVNAVTGELDTFNIAGGFAATRIGTSSLGGNMLSIGNSGGANVDFGGIMTINLDAAGANLRFIRNSTSISALTFQIATNTVVITNPTLTNPRLGTGSPIFNLSGVVAGAVALDATQYVNVTIGGVAYKLALAV